MVYRRKAFVHCGAHGAEDEQGREIDVAHQSPAEQAPVLVSAMNAAGDEKHQPVWPGQVHKLVPPSVHDQSNVKSSNLFGVKLAKAALKASRMVDAGYGKRWLLWHAAQLGNTPMQSHRCHPNGDSCVAAFCFGPIYLVWSLRRERKSLRLPLNGRLQVGVEVFVFTLRSCTVRFSF